MDNLILARVLAVVAVLIGGYALFLRSYALQLERNSKRLSSLVKQFVPTVAVVRTRPIIDYAGGHETYCWLVTTSPFASDAKYLRIGMARAEFTLERDAATQFTSGADAEAAVLALGYSTWSYVYKDTFK